MFTITITAVNDPPVVSNDAPNESVDYSDPITSVKVTAADLDSVNLIVPNQTPIVYVYTPIGGTAQAAVSGLPAGLSIALTAAAPGGPSSTPGVYSPASSAQWTISGKMNVPAGLYAITVPVSDGAAGAATVFTITVTKEDMAVDNTGQTMFVATKVGAGVAVPVSALLTEDPDSNLGPLAWNSTAVALKVRFEAWLAETSTLMGTCDATVPAQTASGTGTASCTLPTLYAETYRLHITLLDNAYYSQTGGQDDVVLTVSEPGFTTGGGWIVDPKVGRANFGFNAKFGNNGTNVQGSSLFIYRQAADLGVVDTVCRASRTYTVTVKSGKTTTTTTVTDCAPNGERPYHFIIKNNGNSMSQLAQGCATGTGEPPCWGWFSGNAKVKAVDPTTGYEYILTTNYIGNQGVFRVDVVDNGEPGSSSAITPDTYAITYSTPGGGTFFQTGPADVVPPAPLPLKGGNIQVHLK
jgi:hypothetical protein